MRLITKNLINIADITASSENVYFPILNLKNQLRSKRFRTIGNDDQWIKIDFGAGSIPDVDSVIILFPKEGKLNLSGTEVIKLQANPTDSWETPELDITLTVSQYRQTSHYFTGNQSYRYWRVLIDDPTSQADYIELSKIIIGKSESIHNAQNGFVFGYVDNTKVQRNEFGSAYADIFPIIKTLNVDYNVLDYDTVTALESIFMSVGNSTAIFMCLDPSSVTFNKDHYSIYGIYQSEFSSQHINYKLFNSSGFKITELN